MGKNFKRKKPNRKIFKKIYIFTEGEKTEVNYLKWKKQNLRRHTNVEIYIYGTGYNTKSLVDYIIQQKQSIEEGDEYWAVFDWDGFPDFDNAIERAKANDINVAYSNESFELWYLLHFEYLNTGIGRDQYCRKLTRIGKKEFKDSTYRYQKGAGKIESLIVGKEDIAIKNAKKLLKYHGSGLPYSKMVPSTTMHSLVESLNKLMD